MANADSNTNARPEFTLPDHTLGSTLTALMTTPLGAKHDLFQVLEGCQRYADELIETHDITARMALCGRLLAGMEVMRGLLDAPLPAHLIARLTVEDAQELPGLIACDSETLREYCAALILILLNHQESPEQEKMLTGVLYELIDLLARDLKAPRFLRTPTGLVTLEGEPLPQVH